MSEKVMIAVDRNTKNLFRELNFPAYIKTDEARIVYLIEKFKHIKP